jgi:hypothetical protein
MLDVSIDRVGEVRTLHIDIISDTEGYMSTVDIRIQSLEDLGAFNENERQGHRFRLNGEDFLIFPWGADGEHPPKLKYHNGNIKINISFNMREAVGHSPLYDEMIAALQANLVAPAGNQDPVNVNHTGGYRRRRRRSTRRRRRL